MNPTATAKQQRQQDGEALREEVTRLREVVRSLRDGGAAAALQDESGLSLPPQKEVLGKNNMRGGAVKCKHAKKASTN